jgi:hypothetical protein
MEQQLIFNGTRFPEKDSASMRVAGNDAQGVIAGCEIAGHTHHHPRGLVFADA